MNHTQYLLRFDDICPTMNWRVWSEVESLLIQHDLKPMVAVVPDNQDPGLRVEPPITDFWERLRIWQARGWTIAMHGYQHRYVSPHAGLVAIRKKSEFAGLPADEQETKLQRSLEIFQREGITPRVWIAPGNTFDATTVALLPEIGIRIICDGYFRFPYACPPPSSPFASEEENESEESDSRASVAGLTSSKRGWMTWIPQQLFYFRPAPPGVWTVCYHHNEWTPSQVRKFREDVEGYGSSIVALRDVLPNVPRLSRWSEWICARPRLSRLLIRGQLELWNWCAGLGRRQRPDMNAIPLSR